MKLKSMMALILTVFFGFAGMAQANDSNDALKTSCSDLVGMATAKDNTLELIIFWVDGYLSAQSDNTLIDKEWIEQLTTSILEFCKANPSKTLGDAMDALPDAE